MNARRHESGKPFTVLLIIAIALSLSSCTTLNKLFGTGPKATTERPAETDRLLDIVQSGTDGITIDFVSPPKEVFNGDYFPVTVSVKNVGSFDVGFVKDSIEPGYYLEKDRAYVNFLPGDEDIEIMGQYFISSEEGDETLPKDVFFSLKGKSYEDNDGEEKIIKFLANAKKGGSSVTLNARLCYPYTTRLFTDICIDPDIYDENPIEKACESKETTGSETSAICFSLDIDRTLEQKSPLWRAPHIGVRLCGIPIFLTSSDSSSWERNMTTVF